MAEERRQQAQKEAAREKQILSLFGQNQTLVIAFSFSYPSRDRVHAARMRQALRNKNKEAYKNFVYDNILNPIGKSNLLYWDAYDDTNRNYVVEITQAGYEKLKNNPYVRGIRLVKTR